MPCRTFEEQQQVWSALKDMRSFCFKGACPKASRWNAWIEAAEDGMREWWGTRMILEYYLDGLPDPDDPSLGGFKDLRAKKTSGLPLAYLSLSQRNWEQCKLLQIFGKPCWSWFTIYHRTVKSAKDALAYSIAMSTQWMASDHLRELAALCNPLGKERIKPCTGRLMPKCWLAKPLTTVGSCLAKGAAAYQNTLARHIAILPSLALVSTQQLPHCSS